MTTPDLSSIIPSKWKTYVGLIGSVLSFVVPLILSVEDYLPAPWPAVIGGVLAVLTALGVYHAPYVPPGAVVVPEVAVRPAGIPGATGTILDGTLTVKNPSRGGIYTNPWKP